MSLVINPNVIITDTDGAPRVGAKMFVYEAGTTTEKDIWNDSAFTSAADNPAISDSNGFFPVVYVEGVHKIVFKTSADVVLAGGGDNIEAATVSSASTTVEGTVQFATPSQVAAQTAGFVIDSGDTASIPLAASSVSGVLAVNNIPNLPASKTTSGTFDAARIPASTETAIGGVEKATSAEVTAGTADKFIDAALLKVAIGAIAEATFTGAGNKWVKITADTGDLLIQWDTETVTPNTSTTITLAETYADTTYAAIVTANDQSDSRSENNGAFIISSSQLQLWSGDSSVNSLFWITIGEAA